LESGEGGQDRSTNPYRVFTLRRSNNFDFYCGWCKVDEFLLHAVSNSREHCCSSRKDDVSVQIFTDVDVAFHDGVVCAFVNTSRFTSNEGRLEECLRATEAFISDSDDLTIRKFVALFKGGGRSSGFHFSVEVKGNVAEFFLDVTDDFTFSGGCERVTTFSEDFHEVVSQITSSHIETHDGVREGISFIDWDSVANSISNIEDNTSCTSRSVEGEDSLDGDIHGRGVEGFEHDLSHFFTIGLRIQWGLSEEDRVFLRSNTKLVVEGVVPDLFHIVPVGDNTVFNWVFERQDSTFRLGLVTYVRVLLPHTNHDSLMARTTDY